MKFSEVVEHAIELLRRRARITYRALKREFDLDDEALGDLKAELIDAQHVARDEDGKVLVWRASPVSSSTSQVASPSQFLTPKPRPLAERRQLTVMFCDLVGSTALSARLDPEDLREVVRQYQQTCAEVIQRHDGYIAQYLGDGLLVYFGYPTAHEDDARRAVRAGLEIIQTLHSQVPSPLAGEGQGEGAVGATGRSPLQVRIGIHTGLVVVGDIGASGRAERLAVGETPNIAARIQGLAEPNTILISAATQRLIEGQFECQPFGSHVLKGIDTPIAVYHVQSERQHVSPLAGKVTLTPLVGREREVGLLVDRWEQVKEARGQVVLLSGEPGIGKSRLAYTLRERIREEGSLLFEACCSPYHQHSALYPVIDVLQRLWLLNRHEPEEAKVQKVEQALALYNMQDTVPLFTALLSLPTPPGYPALNSMPQKQKERTLQALLQLLIAQAERQAIVLLWEDLHWADPSSLEFLSLLIDQIPTTKLLLVLTFRPEFTPPWRPRSHLSHLVLNRLGKKQVEAMIEKVAEGDALPAEVVEQIRIKTDGVPLFIEELTKSVLESAADVGARRAVPLQTIPATLQEALLARLDRLSDTRQVAQLGATLGREFSYELLHAVAPLNETDFQTALTKLVEAEILYQCGVGEQARYVFKHALIQDTAYQSLLKSTRQHYHQQIAQALEERFPDTKETQPELLAHHYTEAGLIEQAIPFWQRAGQRANQHSAYVEAISHFTRGLGLLNTLPDTPERVQQELTLQISLGVPLQALHGSAAPEVEQTYTRARALCRQIGETPQLFPVLFGLRTFYYNRGELQIARELGEQLLRLAQRRQDPDLLLEASRALGATLSFIGELTAARTHLEQGIALYNLQLHRSHAFLYG
jgi:class 3 adenylate cyclase/tetratricopeptide (TPR) repeat protein